MERVNDPQLHIDAAGIAHSRRFNDVYASSDGALAQARAVYLAGTDLPTRWHKQKQHTILELGFGLGVNFLATIQAWLADPNRCNTLDYIGIEAYPISQADWGCLAPTGDLEIDALRTQLRQQWPSATEPHSPGFHVLEFAHGKLRLILVFWDVLKALVELDARVDSVFLDGFSPAKNAEMWVPAVLKGVRRLLNPKAQLASYSVAGNLRAELAALGFSVLRKTGFGAKKQRLKATLLHAQAAFAPEPIHSVAVVGGGIAGLALSEYLLRHGLAVTLFERGASVGSGASGVPAALLHPPSGFHDSLEFGLQSHAYRLTQQRFAALQQQGLVSGFQASAIYERRKNGRTVQHSEGGWFRPNQWLLSLQTACQNYPGFTLHWNCGVDALRTITLRPAPNGQRKLARI
jgi:tRNA 5-methylaminomethyl-2-thiouridine biosynthesis bifunctional protein